MKSQVFEQHNTTHGQYDAISLLHEQIHEGQVIEESGVVRQVFKLPTGQTVCFYSSLELANDTPITELPGALKLASTDSAVVIGRTQVTRHQRTSSIYTPNTRTKTKGNIVQNSELIVEATSMAILEAASSLLRAGGVVADEKAALFSEAARSIEQGNPTDFAKVITDSLIAFRLIGETELGVELINNEPEALVLTSLVSPDDSLFDEIQKLGLLLKEQITTEREKEAQRLQQVASTPEFAGVEALPLSKYCLVHITSLRPIKKAGKWVQPTRQSGTGEYFRNTLHFTINNTVESHMMGNWDDKDTVILSPLERLYATYPQQFEIVSPIDTALAMDYNQDVTFPEGTIVVHGGLLSTADAIYETVAPDEIKYRRHDFTDEQAASLLSEQTLDKQKGVIRSCIVQLFPYNFYDPQHQDIYSTFLRAAESFVDKLATVPNNGSLLRSIDALVQQMNDLYSTYFSEDTLEKDQIKNSLEARLAQLAREHVVHMVLREAGYPLVRIGEHSGGPVDQKLEKSFEKGLLEHGMYVSGNHAYAPGNTLNHFTMDAGLEGREALIDEPTTLESLAQKVELVQLFGDVRTLSNEQYLSLPIETLRVAYMMGVLPLLHKDSTVGLNDNYIGGDLLTTGA